MYNISFHRTLCQIFLILKGNNLSFCPLPSYDDDNSLVLNSKIL